MLLIIKYITTILKSSRAYIIVLKIQCMQFINSIIKGKLSLHFISIYSYKKTQSFTFYLDIIYYSKTEHVKISFHYHLQQILHLLCGWFLYLWSLYFLILLMPVIIITNHPLNAKFIWKLLVYVENFGVLFSWILVFLPFSNL